MNNYNSFLKFNEINKDSHYLRVDKDHPLELLIGLNDRGQKTIRYIGEFKKTQVKSTKSIEVNHFSYQNMVVVSFSLINEEFSDLFYLFCNDLIDSSRAIEQSNGYSFLINRYEKWKGFANTSRKYLSEIEIRGLIGELLFLKNDLFNLYGISKSILGWSGPEPTKKDFYFDNIWYEVKTVTRDVVTISSIEQLDSDNNGFLILFYLEKLSPEANELTINKLVDEILQKTLIDQDRSNFIMKLVQLGYYKEEYYNDFVYSLSKYEYYEVNSCFPCLNRSGLDKAISNARYDLIINMLESFKRDNL